MTCCWQAFSQGGLRKGFKDTRGTMFFEIQRILAAKQPAAFLLENVKQLRGHDGGRTLKTIIDILEGKLEAFVTDDVPMSEEARQSLSRKLDYNIAFKVLRSTDFNVPQKRERVYIVGLRRYLFDHIQINEFFEYLPGRVDRTCLGDILEPNCEVDPKYTISDRLLAGHERRRKEHAAKGNGFGYSLFTHSRVC